MIIFGTLFIAIGCAALFDLNIWPTLLIGLGSGLVISGILGKFGFEPISAPGMKSRRGERRQEATSTE